MKFAPFTYHDPETIEEVVALIGGVDNGRILAGGQSLLAMMAMRYAQPDHLIDLRKVSDIANIEEADDVVTIGSMVRQSEIEFSGLVADRLPLLKEAVLNVGHRQTRNRGTLGGSLCHLDPSAEQVCAAVAFDAELIVQGPVGRRSIPISEWSLGFMTPNLAPDEFLIGVRFVPWPVEHGWCFTEVARRHGDFAIVCAAALVELDDDGCFARVSLSLGGAAHVPVRLADAERGLVGQRADIAVIREASEAARQIEAISDPFASAKVRSHLACVVARRALDAAAQRAKNFRVS